MQWARRAAMALAMAAAGGGVWYLVAGPGAVTATEPPAPNAATLPLVSEGNTFVLWGSRDGQGVKDCEVTARRFELSADGRYRVLEEITKATFYENERVVARATAGRARQDQYRNLLDVAGGLTVRLEPGTRVADGKGATVTTSRARWEGGPRRLTLPEELLFTHERSRFRAQSATIDFPTSRAQLREVRGTAGDALVSSPAARYDLERHTVAVERLEYRLPGLTARVARARLNTKSGEFAGEQVTMKATVSEVEPARGGGRLLAGAALAALAATSAPAAPAPGAAKTSTREVDFTAGSVRYDKARQLWLLEGQARFKHRDAEFTAERIEAHTEVQGGREEIRLVVATGSPRAVDPRSTITGEKFTIHPRERRVVVEGGFKVVTRPKEGEEAAPRSAPAARGSGGNDSRPSGDARARPAGTGGTGKSLRDEVQGETTITGDRLVYNYRLRDVEAEGSVKLVNRGRTVTAQRLTYTDRTEDLVLHGEKVRWEDEKGQHLVARGPIKMNLKQGSETIEVSQPVTGRFLITEEEDDEEARPADSTGERGPPPAPRARR